MGESLDRVRTLFLTILAALVPNVAAGDPLTVRFHDVVQPDGKLEAFVAHLKQLDPQTTALRHKAVNALFAERVKTFRRSLDPFQPWSRTADISSDYLKAAADLIVEQGEPEEGKPTPDYRPDALKQIIQQVSDGQPFGVLKEVPGAICAPAEYTLDRKAARTFAKKFELDAYSLRFFSQEKFLYARPNLKSDLVATVPPYTLMVFAYDPKAREPWSLYESSGGEKGYVTDDKPVLGLSQHHVCFGKVKGEYRIVALFGYGL
jgi:hypothetical protein